MLHISHDKPGEPVTKVDKVTAVMDLLTPRFRQYYSPSVNLSIDKTMVGFRGRSSSLQYIPNKPTKWGIKAFTMADGANGYLLNVLLYTGAEMLHDARSEYSDLPVPARVVLELTEPYLGQGISRLHGSVLFQHTPYPGPHDPAHIIHGNHNEEPDRSSR